MKTSRKIVFAFITTVLVFAATNLAASKINPKHTVFWRNATMIGYLPNVFDETVTTDSFNRDNRPDRQVRYVPDDFRWYRLDPEPEIPAGKLVLNFGDSSTWGWGLENRNSAYAGALNGYLPADTTSVNLGVPGYSSLQGLRYLQEVLPKVSERVVAVTVYFGNNDSTENSGADRKLIQGEASMAQVVLRKLALFRLLRDCLWTRIEKTNSEPRVSPEEFVHNLRAMISLTEQYKIPLAIIVPLVPRTWPPGYLTRIRSLESRVSNQWTRNELQHAKDSYAQGQELLLQQDDGSVTAFEEAIEHDWVLPRIKKPWLEQLESLEKTGVKTVRVPSPRLDEEYPYNFEDYCHPSAHLHKQITEKLVEIFKG